MNIFMVKKKKKFFFSWKALTAMSEINIYPQFLRYSLKNIPSTIKNIVNSIPNTNYGE